MKLNALVAAAVAGGFIAADKAPDFTNMILAADKRAKDNTGLGPKNLQHTEDRARDEREEAEDTYAEAMDSKMEAADAEEEKADEGKSDKATKDRKAARDARKGARDARKAARDARKGARDKRAKDRAKDGNLDPEHTNPGGGAGDGELETADPNPPGGPREKGETAVDKKAMDAAIAAAIADRDALHVARAEVAPILGVTTFDKAGDTYRTALTKLGVDTAGVPDSALRAMLTLAKDRATAATAAPASAMDAATSKAVAAAIPGLNRLRR